MLVGLSARTGRTVEERGEDQINCIQQTFEVYEDISQQHSHKSSANLKKKTTTTNNNYNSNYYSVINGILSSFASYSANQINYALLLFNGLTLQEINFTESTCELKTHAFNPRGKRNLWPSLKIKRHEKKNFFFG